MPFPVVKRQSPAHFVEALRLESARILIDKQLPLKRIAAKVGLSPIRLNNAFERRFGMQPRLFRDMHGPQHAAATKAHSRAHRK